MACVFRRACETSVESEQPPSPLLAGRQCLTCPARPSLTDSEIFVTMHVLDRLAERAPERGSRDAVRREVRSAIAAGRVSEGELPRWVKRPCSPRIPEHAYCWSPDRELVFVLMGPSVRHGLTVKTVLTVHADRERAA